MVDEEEEKDKEGIAMAHVAIEMAASEPAIEGLEINGKSEVFAIDHSLQNEGQMHEQSRQKWERILASILGSTGGGPAGRGGLALQLVEAHADVPALSQGLAQVCRATCMPARISQLSSEI